MASNKTTKKIANDRDVGISKTLSYLLRHAAVKEGLPIEPDGFINLCSILSYPEMKRKSVQLSDIKRVVLTNNKMRFTLVCLENVWKIKANQGHSLKEVTELSLTQLTIDKINFEVVHGTYYIYWMSIKRDGLKRMTRNHIHFACTAIFKENVSGFRKDAEVLIFINVHAALKDGIEFYRSENNVILSEGLNGVLETKYFSKVVDRKRGTTLDVF